jgi:hypothetical protein
MKEAGSRIIAPRVFIEVIDNKIRVPGEEQENTAQ